MISRPFNKYSFPFFSLQTSSLSDPKKVSTVSKKKKKEETGGGGKSQKSLKAGGRKRNRNKKKRSIRDSSISQPPNLTILPTFHFFLLFPPRSIHSSSIHTPHLTYSPQPSSTHLPSLLNPPPPLFPPRGRFSKETFKKTFKKLKKKKKLKKQKEND